jgi:hypothetical protein
MVALWYPGPEMTQVARRDATYEDILAAPEHMVAELLAGELHLHL